MESVIRGYDPLLPACYGTKKSPLMFFPFPLNHDPFISDASVAQRTPREDRHRIAPSGLLSFFFQSTDVGASSHDSHFTTKTLQVITGGDALPSRVAALHSP